MYDEYTKTFENGPNLWLANKEKPSWSIKWREEVCLEVRTAYKEAILPDSSRLDLQPSLQIKRYQALSFPYTSAFHRFLSIKRV